MVAFKKLISLFVDVDEKYGRLLLQTLNRSPGEFVPLYAAAKNITDDTLKIEQIAGNLEYRGYIRIKTINYTKGPYVQITDEGIKYVREHRLLLIVKENKDLFMISIAFLSLIVSIIALFL